MTHTLTFNSETKTLSGFRVKAIKALLEVTPKEKDHKPHHTCFALVLLHDGLFLCATNGYVLARVPVNLNGNWPETQESLTCSRATIEAAIKPFKPGAFVELTFSVPDMNYPAVRHVLPKPGEFSTEQIPFLAAKYVENMAHLADTLNDESRDACIQLRSMESLTCAVEYGLYSGQKTLGFFVIMPVRN